jgi:3-hydroxyacyl-[acyl-carrier-protein] dehydratase
MLQGDFFTINKMETASFTVQAELVLNASHKIFEGHFPGQPVVPGVCMMQMVKEILEQAIGEKTKLIQASEMKFLAVINPQETNMIQAFLKYALEENGIINLSAALQKEDLIYFKIKGKLELSDRK